MMARIELTRCVDLMRSTIERGPHEIYIHELDLQTSSNNLGIIAYMLGNIDGIR